MADRAKERVYVQYQVRIVDWIRTTFPVRGYTPLRIP